MFNSVGDLCGYVYITPSHSFMHFCRFCEKCFELATDFQNHLKDHFEIGDVDQQDDGKDVAGNQTNDPLEITLRENQGEDLQFTKELHANIDQPNCFNDKENELDEMSDTNASSVYNHDVSLETKPDENSTTNHTEVDIKPYKFDLCESIYSMQKTLENHNKKRYSGSFLKENEVENLQVTKEIRDTNIEKPIDLNDKENELDEMSDSNAASVSNYNVSFETKPDENSTIKHTEGEKTIEHNHNVSLVSSIAKQIEVDKAIEHSNEYSSVVFPFGLNDLDEISLQCRYCNKMFQKRDSLIEHTQNHFNYILTCNICKKHYSTKYRAESHKNSHSKIKCDLCEAVYSTQKALENHIKKKHSCSLLKENKIENLHVTKEIRDTNIEKSIDFNDKEVELDGMNDSNATSASKHNVSIEKNWNENSTTKHTQVNKTIEHNHNNVPLVNSIAKQIEVDTAIDHSNENSSVVFPFGLNDLDEISLQCRYCNKMFQRRDSLNEHTQNHFNYILTCNICKKHYSTKYRAESHKNSHSKIKCDLCEAVYSTQKALENHIKKKHSCSLLKENKIENLHVTKEIRDTNIEKSIDFNDKEVELDAMNDSNATSVSKHNVSFEKNSTTKHKQVNKAIEHNHNNVPLVNSIAKQIEVDEAIEHLNENSSIVFPFGLNDLDEISLRCRYCNKMFLRRDCLIEHTQNHFNYILTCNICKKHYSTKASAESHKRIHSKQKCDLCYVSFQSRQVLKNHRKKQHEIKKPLIKCQSCSKVFKSDRGLKQHLFTHKGEEPYKCDICRKIFTLKSNLDNHLIMQHTVYTQNFACEFCDRKFKTKGILNLHLNIRHTGNIKDIACEFCDRKFKARAKCNVHIKTVHLKEKPHQCEMCGADFVNTTQLKRHKMYHHDNYNDRPYQCKLCDKKYVIAPHLEEHMNFHTRAKPYKCKICLRGFRRYSTLTAHRKLHTGKKELICKICGKAFAQHSCLGTHMRQKHKITSIKLV